MPKSFAIAGIFLPVPKNLFLNNSPSFSGTKKYFKNKWKIVLSFGKPTLHLS